MRKSGGYASEGGISVGVLPEFTLARAAAHYLLRRIAEITGGSYWTVASDGRLEPTFRKVLEAANERYVLRYEPRGVARAGLHRLEVSMRLRGVEVRARREYVIPGVSR